MKTPPPIRKTIAKIEYFVIVNDEQTGPYDLAKIELLLEFNNINENTLIWREGMVDWDIISNVEEFTNLIYSGRINAVEINLQPSEIIDKQEEIKDIKKNTARKDYVKWFSIISLVGLTMSIIAVIGALNQYIHFENTKEIDLSYIGSFSIVSSALTIFLSLVCTIYFIKKNRSFYKNIISFCLGTSAGVILVTTESNYKEFWEPYWKNDVKLWALDTLENKPELSQVTVREGWRNQTINIDSLKTILELINRPKKEIQIEFTDENINKVEFKESLNKKIKTLEKELILVDKKLKVVNDKIVQNEQTLIKYGNHNHQKAIESGECSGGFCFAKGYEMEARDEKIILDRELKNLSIKRAEFLKLIRQNKL